jgi:hypothetical protein
MHVATLRMDWEQVILGFRGGCWLKLRACNSLSEVMAIAPNLTIFNLEGAMGRIIDINQCSPVLMVVQTPQVHLSLYLLPKAIMADRSMLWRCEGCGKDSSSLYEWKGGMGVVDDFVAPESLVSRMHANISSLPTNMQSVSSFILAVTSTP